MHKTLCALSTLFALTAVACSSSDSGGPASPGPGGSQTLTVARSDLSREPAANVPEATLAAVVEADNAFAFDLFGKVRESQADKNMVLSPLSVSLALSMTYAGAKNTTASEMAGALRFPEGLDAHAGQNALGQALESRAADALAAAQHEAEMGGADAPSPDDFRLHIVNSVWGDGTYTWEKPFLDTLARDYGAGVYLADFVHQWDAERLRINAWVSEETKNKINDLLSPGTVDDATRLVLVNAMHLKLPWANPFEAEATKPGSFTKGDGSTVTASFMSQARSFDYYEDAHAQIVSLPLAGGKISLVVALPTGALSDYEASLDASAWKSAWAARSAHEVALTLPKFTFTSESIKLKSVLESLGIAQAFDPDAADFYGMCSQPPNGERLFVSDVVHKAMMAVDEHGVEAAAATAVVMAGGTSVPPTPIPMTVDKPFVVALVDEPTGALLFLGHIDDPTAKGSP